MFGLPSLPKLVVLGVVIAAVWYGFKFLGRLQQARKTEAKLREAEARAGKKMAGSKSAAAREEIADLIPCPGCGAYVEAGSRCDCGHQN